MDWKYLIPGVGIYNQLKKPKNERKALGYIGYGLYTLPFIFKVMILPFYIGTGINTGEWNFPKYIKEKIVKIINQNSEKENNLEKIIEFDCICK
jgi:hypothetical protein